MSDAAVFQGGCLCGAIRYRATSAPLRGVICHCSMCRKHSGAPALAFVHFRRQDFMWLHGEPTRYRSSEFAERGFCPTCGSSLSMHEEVLPERVQVTVGSLDEPDRVRIDDHVWTKEQISWFQVADQLPRFPMSSSAVPSSAIRKDSLLVGHSLGASVLLKYLCETRPRPAFAGLFLVATPFWGLEFPEYALPLDFGVRLRDVSPLYFYHSRDDPEVPFEHLERYQRALPHAIVRALDGRGHEFAQAEFPELVEDIRRLDTTKASNCAAVREGRSDRGS